MNTDEPKKNRKKFTWFRFFPSEWVDVLTMTDCQAGKRFKQMLKRLITNSSQENTIEAVMINESIEYSEIKRKAAIRRWNENKKGNKATTPQPCGISTNGPTQAENEEAVATSPSCGGSAANSYAHDALDSLDDKVSDPNCGADAVNSNTTVDRKSATSAPQQRPWKEIVEKSLGITDKSGTEKGVRPPNPVPGLLRKRRAAGSPLNPGTGPSPAARSLPKSMAEVADFATSEGLDYDDCRLWWEQNFVERKGKDKEGRKITNWRGALIRFCASAKRKRESA